MYIDTEKNVEMEDLVDEFLLFYLAGIMKIDRDLRHVRCIIVCCFVQVN